MKTIIIKLLFSAIFLTAFSLASIAQVGTIRVVWNDECLPAVNNTDLYDVTIDIVRNSDQAHFCYTPITHGNLLYYSTWDDFTFTCICADSYYGYTVTASVVRKDHLLTPICNGSTQLVVTCEELTNLDEIKVNIP